MLNGQILRLGELLQRCYRLDQLTQPYVISQEPVHAVGRIARDGQGRLNYKSILLKGGKGNNRDGMWNWSCPSCRTPNYSQERWPYWE